MASAYATLENDGMYRNPTCVTSIVDSDNNIIYTSSQKDTVIYSENAARTMTDVMTGVMTQGTGRKAKLDNGMPSAGKTGTTNDKKDGWFCGFTRYYTTCVWVGCDMPETIKDLTGGSYPAEIWKTYMDQIHSDLTPLNFLPYAHMSDESQDNQESQEVQDTPADDQTQNNPTDQTVTTPDEGTTTPDQTTTDPNKTDAAGGNHEKTPTTPSENPSGGDGDSGSAGGTGGTGDSGSAGGTGGAGDNGSTGGAGGAGGSGSTGGAGGAGGSGSTGGTGGAGGSGSAGNTGGTTGGEGGATGGAAQ